MKRAARVLAILLTLVLGAVADDTSPGAAAAAANNAFAIDIYPKIARQSGNLFFSPYSAETALVMAWAGARSATALQMAQVLHLPRDRAAVADDFAALVRRLKSGGEQSNDELKGEFFRAIPYQLFIMNSIWCQSGSPFRDQFLKSGREKFHGDLNMVDFEKAPDSARSVINDWASNATRGRIHEIIPLGVIDTTTRMVLANTVYFKAQWHALFDKSKTATAVFHDGSGGSEDVPFMYVKSQFNYGESKTMQVLDLPYFSGKMSMIILLPKEADALPAVERTMDPISMTGALSWMKPQEVEVYLPKCQFPTDIRFSEILQEMGMTDAFSPDFAKFSGISNQRLYISAVLQKAFIEVNEEGTEATAVTGVELAQGMAPSPPPSILFRADHPFMFLIRHNDTGAILFMGRVARP